MRHHIIWGISRRFRRLSPCDGQVAHVLRTLPPVAVRALLLHAKLQSYAVLAFFSERYPPLKGRLLTRYSPVRH